MKKFMKVCGITALIFLMLGIVLAVAAGTAKGRTAINQVLETVTGGRVTVDFSGLVNWGLRFRGNVTDSLPELDYDINEAGSMNPDYTVMEGDVEKFCLGEDVKRLEVEAGGCRFIMRASGDSSFYAEASKVGKFQAYLENGTLYVRATTSSRQWNSWNNVKVTLYVPEGYHYENVKIDLGAGSMEFEELDADKVSLGVGAGQITASGLKTADLTTEAGAGRIELREADVGKLKLEVGMGEISVEGNISGSAEVNCAMGNVEMKLAGSQKDFNYRLVGAMGNIDLGQEHYSGLAMSKDIDNGAARDMKVECEAGNITITFAD